MYKMVHTLGLWSAEKWENLNLDIQRKPQRESSENEQRSKTFMGHIQGQ